MDILLHLEAEAAQVDRWRAALAVALPEATWHEPPCPDALRQSIELAVVASPSPGSLQGYPSLRFVQSLWAGVDRLLADESVPANLVLARMVDPALATAMAEAVQWAVLTLHRRFSDYARQQSDSNWRVQPQLAAGNVAVIVLGAGEVARPALHRLAAMGYRVRAWHRTSHRQDHGLDGVLLLSGEAQLWDALATSDIVVNLLPLTTKTRGILNRGFFARMKPGASLVNFARGAHLVEEDLLDALESGALDHALLDVFKQEPLPRDHPFWRHPRITVLPHVAAQTDPESASGVVADQIRRWVNGQQLKFVVSGDRGY